MDLKVKREKVIDTMEDTVTRWDGTYESGIEIIERIQESIEDIEKINNLIEEGSGSLPYDNLYEEKIRSFKKTYEYLLKKLEIEKKKLFELMKETRLKDEVKGSYILKKNKSIFIDKDL